MRWHDEIEFWRIPLSALADCCRISDALTPSCKRIDGTSSPSPLSLENVYVESSCPPVEFEVFLFFKFNFYF
jgi:hypothetical protein